MGLGRYGKGLDRRESSGVRRGRRYSFGWHVDRVEVYFGSTGPFWTPVVRSRGVGGGDARRLSRQQFGWELV